MEVYQGEGIGYDLSVVDFEDASHTLAFRDQDGVVIVIRTHEGWAVFKRLCGMAAAPLVMMSGQCSSGAPGTSVSYGCKSL